MEIAITCGPAYEPLDSMRRLTNASTGALGSSLADAFTKAGHRVVLFRGNTATAPLPHAPAELIAFGTNDDLSDALQALSGRRRIDAVFHAAALCDFRLAGVRGPDGRDLHSAKISSREGRIWLELEPATKVLPRLRTWFPQALIVGWKFEANGPRDHAIAAATRQLAEAHTDACVVNGPAWGEGFGLCDRANNVIPLANTEALARKLIEWLANPPPRAVEASTLPQSER